MWLKCSRQSGERKGKEKITRIFFTFFGQQEPLLLFPLAKETGRLCGFKYLYYSHHCRALLWLWLSSRQCWKKKRGGKKEIFFLLFDVQGAALLVLWLKAGGFCYFRIWVKARRHEETKSLYWFSLWVIIQALISVFNLPALVYIPDSSDGCFSVQRC